MKTWKNLRNQKFLFIKIALWFIISLTEKKGWNHFKFTESFYSCSLGQLKTEMIKPIVTPHKLYFIVNAQFCFQYTRAYRLLTVNKAFWCWHMSTEQWASRIHLLAIYIGLHAHRMSHVIIYYFLCFLSLLPFVTKYCKRFHQQQNCCCFVVFYLFIVDLLYM